MATHTRINSNQNNQRAQLANAYQELGKELGREKLKIVGGYTLGRVIGEGTYGSVHIATHRLTATRCAIKKIPKGLTSQLTREIHHHRLLHHPHILHLYEVLATETHIWLVSELCTGGELFDYLVERGRLLEGEARRVFGELVVAVGLLHKKGTVHRDLKLENVLLDGECRVKLGDMGFAREWVKGNKLLETFCGTTGYACPEVLKGHKYNGEEADIWSLGIILYTLLCGGLPFDDDEEDVMKSLIYKGEYEEPAWLSDEAKDLIRSILQQEPTKRITIKGILSHPWFRKRIVDPPLSSIVGAEPGSESPYPPSPDIPNNPHGGTSFFDNKLAMAMAHRSTSEPLPKLHTIQDTEEEGLSPLSSPRRSPRALKPEGSALAITPAIGPNRSDSEGGASSEASFDFNSEKGKSSSVTTSPTTAEGELELPPAVAQAESDKAAAAASEADERPKSFMTQSNASESTIKRPDEMSRRSSFSGGQGSTKGGRAVTLLAKQKEEADEDAEVSSIGSHRPSSFMFEDHLHLPVAGRSRTPSRTKRRSMSSLPDTSRPGLPHHHSWSAEFVPVVDYLAELEATPPPYFSTPDEKQLIGSLEMMGFDVGQLQHSVKTNACDPSAALWWMLRAKQAERAEQEAEKEAQRLLSSAAASPIEPTSAGFPEKGKVLSPQLTTDAVFGGGPIHGQKAKVVAPVVPPPIELGAALDLTKPRRPSISPESRAHTVADPAGLSTSTSGPQVNADALRVLESAPLQSSYSAPNIATTRPKTPPQHFIPLESSKSLGERSGSPASPGGGPKARTSSFTMLQRATSALTGAGLVKRKSDEKLLDELAKASPGDKASPNKLLKSPSGRPQRKNSAVVDLDLDAIEPPKSGPSSVPTPAQAAVPTSTTMDSLASMASSGMSVGSTPSKPSKDRGARREGGLLGTFRSWFEVDKRKRRRESAPGSPHMMSRSGSANNGSTPTMRSQHHHAIKKTTTVMAKRLPSESGRPNLHSRRSSSVNSRRSSVASMHLPTLDIPLALGTQDVALARRHSRRSAGSRTPTSEHDVGSRPSSIHSFHLPNQPPPPPSLHHNKSESTSSAGSNSGSKARQQPQQQHRFPSSSSHSSHTQRNRPNRQAGGAQRRSASGASSAAQSASSRRSSAADHDGYTDEPESEADMSHDDAGSTHSRQRRKSSDSHHSGYQPSIIVAAKRNRSPRVTQLMLDQRLRRISDGTPRAKAPLRDVFAKAGDDEWVSDEDAPGGFAGGLGQGGSTSTKMGTGSHMDSPTAGGDSKFASSVGYRGRTGRYGGPGGGQEPVAAPVPSSSKVVVSQPPSVGIIPEARRGAGRAPFMGRPADITEEEEEEE